MLTISAEPASFIDVAATHCTPACHRASMKPKVPGILRGSNTCTQLSPLILRDEMLGNPLGGMSGRSDGDHACQLRREPWGSEQPLHLGGKDAASMRSTNS